MAPGLAKEEKDPAQRHYSERGWTVIQVQTVYFLILTGARGKDGNLPRVCTKRYTQEKSMKVPSARGAETKNRIIRVAADLFHKQGVRATSPDQVIEASATGKGQFYHYFRNKTGLVHEVLQAHLNAIKT